MLYSGTVKGLTPFDILVNWLLKWGGLKKLRDLDLDLYIAETTTDHYHNGTSRLILIGEYLQSQTGEYLQSQ